MPNQQPDRPTHEHPVIAGLVALVGVAVAIGLVLGAVAAVGTHVLGLGGASARGAATDRATMYIPRVLRTPTPTAAQITLGPAGGQGSGGHQGGHHRPSHPKASKSPEAGPRISLSASTTSASPMEQFDLSGVYPGGEGAILTVQRFQDGGWSDFPATGSVSGGAFQIPVQTSQGGINRFRVVDTDTQQHSNVVRVAIH
jgi:hypothetical protein